MSVTVPGPPPRQPTLILCQDYADPLRNFARKKEEALIPLYEANTLFANIDQILQVNEAFLNDLERMLAPNGERMVGGVGDVALKHVRPMLLSYSLSTHRRTSFVISARLTAINNITASARKPRQFLSVRWPRSRHRVSPHM